MATTNTHVLALAILLIVGTQILGNHKVLAQCQGSFPILTAQCSKFIQVQGPKIPPSEGCCAVIKGIIIPCVCKLVTPEIEKKVSMEKLVYVARTCGATIRPGTKCGSYTVPPVVEKMEDTIKGLL